MAMGMPYHEYWHGNYAQLAHYRKAYELRRERANYDAWIQGAYVYDALCAVSPLFRFSLSSKTIKPEPYHKEPYPVKQSGPVKQAESNAEIEAKVGAAKFFAFALQVNKRLEDKGGEPGGAND